MPITRTPIIDDDGTGTTGTSLDNAWKQELYGQIDAFVGLNPSQRIFARTGTYATTTYASVDSFVIPPLSMHDYLRIVLTIVQANTTAGPLNLTVSGQAYLSQLSGGLAANSRFLADVLMHADATAATWILSQATTCNLTGGVATNQSNTTLCGPAGNANWTTGNWSLGLECSSMGAGGLLTYYWQAYRF